MTMSVKVIPYPGASFLSAVIEVPDFETAGEAVCDR